LSLAQDIRACTACSLNNTAIHKVLGEGPLDARIVLVGEGPGRYEDMQGRPFVGDGGRVLNSFLQKADLQRSELYITNVVKCRPPNNRVPLARELKACGPFLWKELAAIRPAVVVTMGETASKFLIGKKKYRTLTKSNGDVFRIFVTPSLALPGLITWHPASFLRPHPKPRQGQLVRALVKAKEMVAMAERGEIWKDYQG